MTLQVLCHTAQRASNKPDDDVWHLLDKAKSRLDDIIEEFEANPDSVPYQIAAATEIKEIKQALPFVPFIPVPDYRATIEQLLHIQSLIGAELRDLEKQQALEARHLRIMQDDEEVILILSMLRN